MTLVYLSGPIIHVEDRRDDFYKTVIDALKSRGIDVFAPQFFPPAEPREIYERDVRYVRKSDVVVAEVSSPSHGVGMELMLSIELKTPLLLFMSSESERLSKMVSGAPGAALFIYDNVAEVSEILARIDLTRLVLSECARCTSEVLEKSGDKLRCIVCDAIV